MEAMYAPRDDPVFKLVPDAFAIRAHAIWSNMGCPEPDFDTVWDIYRAILRGLREMPADEGFTRMLEDTSKARYLDRNVVDNPIPAELADTPLVRLHDATLEVEVFLDDEEDGVDEDEPLVEIELSGIEEDETVDGHGIGLEYF